MNINSNIIFILVIRFIALKAKKMLLKISLFR